MRDFLKRRLRRYRQDLFGGVAGTIHRSRSRIEGLIAAATGTSSNPSSTARAVEVGERRDGIIIGPMEDYRRQAWMARWLLGAAGASTAVLLHRLLLGDLGGALASLGSTATLLGLALHPAYRCWLMRHQRAGQPHVFLIHPLQWWPAAWPAAVSSSRSTPHEPADR